MIIVAIGSPDSIDRLSERVRPITREGTIVVAGFGDVGRMLVEMLTDAHEDVCVIDATDQPGVDITGDVLDTDVLDRARMTAARVVIVACESDSATLLATTVVRDYAPHVPVIACADLLENVERIQRAGADYTLSVSQVAGQLLVYHILGEMVSQQARIKLGKLHAGRLAGHHPQESRIRDRTGCVVVAVERNGEVIIDMPESFVLTAADELYVCGTVDAFNRFYEEFAEALEAR